MNKSSYKAIGLLGGTFDPPHQGHLKISELALKSLPIDKVYWILTKQNPHKKKSYFTLIERLKQCKKILRKSKKIEVKYLDKFLNSSRFVKIVDYFSNKFKEKTIFILIGSDNLVSFHLWKNYKKILKECVLIVFSRKGYDRKAVKSQIMKKNKNFNIIFFKNKKFNISSTVLRQNMNS